MNREFKKISILSSDEATIRLLGSSLESNSFSSEVLPNTLSLESLLLDTADILILDDQNPFNMSAMDICRITRIKNEEVIIIILTNKLDHSAKILALEFGADDYLEKPANPLEIMARIKVTLKRMNFVEKTASETTEFKFNDLYLDSERRICVANGHELKLSNYEFLTLLYLVQNNGKSVARTKMLTDIWELDSDDNVRPVDDIVRRLRKKLSTVPSSTQIVAIWGHGYRVEAS